MTTTQTIRARAIVFTVSQANSTKAIKPQEFLKGVIGQFEAFPDANASWHYKPRKSSTEIIAIAMLMRKDEGSRPQHLPLLTFSEG
jgi:hypothetical protein